ncbi:hypothetical protein KEM56_007493 [Ascosphaera pollenicola]|nr:hypothetical protein KEM56_007493 [Ascosphaera pollenicola]
MGASESKLVFKQGIFRLSEPAVIPADDPYWAQFWELPESVEDIFSLFGTADVRRTRDNNLENLETLLLAVTSRLIALRNHPSFPDYTYAPARDALNCVRILTRVLPFIFEAEHLAQWQETFFWAKRRKKTREAQLRSQVLFDEAEEEEEELQQQQQQQQQQREEGGAGGREGEKPTSARNKDYIELKPLAEELVDTLIDLLFFAGFTIPHAPNGRGKGKVSYSIWHSGVGCNTAMGTNRELESNRTEILRLLLTLTSESMYMSSALLPVKGVRIITYMVTNPNKLLVLSVLCSLLNTAVKYNPTPWRIPYDHALWKDPKQTLVIYCLQLLLVLVLYPVPEDGQGAAPRNYYRHYFGRLHRPEDFQFIVEGMTRVLNQPMQSTSSYLTGSQKPAKWAPEMIMLFWEALQCNKAFRTFIIESNRVHDFVVLCIFYATEFRMDTSMHGVAKMCIFVLQTLSVEPGFGKSINKQLRGFSTLPASIKVPDCGDSFNGTYADFTIISLHTLMTTSKGQMNTLFPSLLAIFNNMGPYITNLSVPACRKIHMLLAQMSSPRFLIANETNHLLLQALLQFINSILEHQFDKNPNFVYTLLRSRKHYENLREFTLDHTSSVEQLLNQSQPQRKFTWSDMDNVDPRESSQSDQHRGSTSSSVHLGHVPEEGAFAVGDDDSDSEAESTHEKPTSLEQIRSPTRSVTNSRASSIISTTESVPQQLRGMSEKARGKMPVGQMHFSRQNSSASLGSYTMAPSTNAVGFVPTSQWVDSWVTDLPLHATLAVISALMPHMPTPDLPGPSDPEAQRIISNLPAFAEDPSIQTLTADRSPARIHSFEWSPLSLGWYESLLWGSIFTSEMVVGNNTSGSTPGAVGVWNGTMIKLFKVQEGAAQSPSLFAPRGAVDAVGNNLVQRINSLGFRSRNPSSTNISHDAQQ